MIARIRIGLAAVVAVTLTGCDMLNPRPALYGKIAYDDCNGGPSVPGVLYDATVFASVGTFPPPDGPAHPILGENEDPASERVRVLKEVDESEANAPEGFEWRHEGPIFAGATYVQFRVVADRDGNYVFDKLPAGTCFVAVLYHASSPDPIPKQSAPRKIVLKKGRSHRLDIHLTLFYFVSI